jgi:hypothetical protein
VHDVLNGVRKKPPRWKWAASFFRACQRHAQTTGVEVDVVLGTFSEWHRRYEALLNTPAPASPPPPMVAAAPTVGREPAVPPAGEAPPAVAPHIAVNPVTPSRTVVSVPVSPLESVPVEFGTSTLRDVLSAPYPSPGPVAPPYQVLADPSWLSDAPSTFPTYTGYPPPIAGGPPPTPTGHGEVPSSRPHPDMAWPELSSAWPDRTPAPSYEPSEYQVSPSSQSPMTLPQPVEQAAAYATLNALGANGASNLVNKRISGMFGPRGIELQQMAKPAPDFDPRKVQHALACFELGILLVNRNATSEGNQFLQWAQEMVPHLKLGIKPRYGDRFHGSIPREICRQVAGAYRDAGRPDISEKWLAYGDAINADEPICLAVFSTGRHAARARTIQHFTVDNAAKIRRLYWESVLGHTQEAEPDQAMALPPSTELGQTAIPAVQSKPMSSNAPFTTREMEMLNALLTTNT